MTWLTTWPHHGIPQFAEHPTEAKAEAHARERRVSGACEAVHFWSEATEEAS